MTKRCLTQSEFTKIRNDYSRIYESNDFCDGSTLYYLYLDGYYSNRGLSMTVLSNIIDAEEKAKLLIEALDL